MLSLSGCLRIRAWKIFLMKKILAHTETKIEIKKYAQKNRKEE